MSGRGVVWLRIWSFVVVALTLSACGGGSDGDGIIGTGFTINGRAEKGPFIANSLVTVNLLNNDGTSKTQTLNTLIKDELGSFSFSLPSPGAIQISASGYHFNEISGRFSDGTLTLYAAYDATEKATQNAYVNVLTHLIHSRVLKLMKDGKTISEAIRQAQTELITALVPVLPVKALPDFTRLRVYNSDDTVAEGNAYLLALSATIYQYATSQTQLSEESESAELTLVLNSLAVDLSDDGLLNSDLSLVSDLVTASRVVDPALVEKNLKLHSFRVIHEQLAVPNINLFLDTDGDGSVNNEDIDDDNDGIPDIQDKNPYKFGELKITIVQPVSDSGGSSSKLRSIVADESLVQKIEYLIDGELIGESSKPPFEITWNSYFWSDTTSKYSLVTRITDTGGNKQLGPVVELSVAPIFGPVFRVKNTGNVVIRDKDAINLNWEILAGAEKYEVEVRNEDNGQLVETQKVLVPSLLAQNLREGKYSWRLRAANIYDNWGPWSEYFSFTVAGPVPPTFISPMAGAAIVDTDSPTFTWKPVAAATGYEIEISSSRDFIPVLQSKELTGISYTSSALPQGQYYVRIRSKNSLQFWGEWNPLSAFILRGPDAPLLVSPTDNASVGTLVDVTFSWSPSEGAKGYVFQLSKSSTFTMNVVETEITTTALTRQLSIGRYYWRVRAKNVGGSFGEWSGVNIVSAGLFTKSYGGAKSDTASAIKETENGGYIIVGSTDNGSVRNGGIYLLKINSTGAEEWHQTFDTAASEYGRDVIELSNGNFIVIGDTDYGPSAKLWLIEVSSTGDKLSERFIKNETFGGLLSLEDGYVLGTNLFVSEKTVNGSISQQYVPKIIRYGLSHIEVWAHTFDESVTAFVSIQSLEIDSDGNIVVAGAYDPSPDDLTNQYANQAYIYSLSPQGADPKYFKLTDHFLGYGNVKNKPLSGGRQFLATYGMGSQHVLYNSIGEKLWSANSQMGYGNAAPLISSVNDRIEVVQYGQSYENGSNFSLRRFVYDAEGYILNDTKLINDGTSYERSNGLRQILATRDGGYILLSSSAIAGNTDIVVTKIGSD